MDCAQGDYIVIFLIILAVWGIAALVIGVAFLWHILVKQKEVNEQRKQIRNEWFD